MSSGPRRSGSRRRPAVVGDNDNRYVETDPTGRYGRFDELLGKGAMKSVYRGFDSARGVEVAWNQAHLCDVVRTPESVQRMYSEVQLLRTLRHDSLMGFHASWLDLRRRTFNFVTDLFCSGTLRSYRRRHPRVGLGAVRCWARQVLRGVAYLHARDPPVVHRDLKCDNLFVNGHSGQVKIGDLGLAAVLGGERRKASSVVGTPEFMAPEMYEEAYDERVDVYAFGMCVLEMITLEIPYAECRNPAQIYKKVTAGKLPDAFYRRGVPDEARRFIGRCLLDASKRPSAAELLLDPFLLLDDDVTSLSSPRPHLPPPAGGPLFPSSDNVTDDDDDHTSSSSVLSGPAEPPLAIRSDMSISGKLNAEEDTIFLKVQITEEDETGRVRNIYFPFDLAGDTAIEVAREMVKELEITYRDPVEIAAMIEQEIHRLLPDRGRGEQHEYSYDENEAFDYLSSSPASSSSGGFFSAPPHSGGWSKDHYYSCTLSDDDDTSSVHSGQYSALHYASGHEEEDPHEAQQQQVAEVEARPGSSSKTTTRFGPGESSSSTSPTTKRAELQFNKSAQYSGRPRQRDDEEEQRRRRRMSRNRSMVDMRSQLLHRTLVEELNRRLFFNTVGAVENIGFRAPSGYGSSSSSSVRGRGRVVDHHRGTHDGRRSKEDDNNRRYYML